MTGIPGLEASQRCAFGQCQNPITRKHDQADDDLVYCHEHVDLAGRDPCYVVREAVEEAREDLNVDTTTLVKWPLPSLHEFLGFLLPGTVTYGAAFSKNGKTKFISQMIAAWARAGVRPWVMPTESMPRGLMTRLACEEAGVDADEALSFRLRERADRGDMEAFRQIAELDGAYTRILTSLGKDGATLAIEPTPMLTQHGFSRSCRAAAQAGCGIVICDHVDQITGNKGSNTNGYQASEAVQHDALDFAQKYDIPVLLMTQLNPARAGGDALHAYRRPMTDWLWMPGKKVQVATTIFGIYRPIDPRCDETTLRSAREGKMETWRVAIPNTMGIADMASRFNGAKRDRVLHLGVEHGKIVDEPTFLQNHHGISTRPPGSPRAA